MPGCPGPGVPARTRPGAAPRAALDLLESGPGWELHGKTGWCFDCTPELGWWVGWVKRNERLYG
ncbi:hypothetical protein I5F76_27795, partial [Pseudomonas aeruginosa]|nr:hypothetical protein [Pseudomonas aeruginosa]